MRLSQRLKALFIDNKSEGRFRVKIAFRIGIMAFFLTPFVQFGCSPGHDRYNGEFKNEDSLAGPPTTPEAADGDKGEFKNEDSLAGPPTIPEAADGNKGESKNEAILAGPPTITEAADGNNQSARVDQKLLVSPAVLVKDAQGIPAPGARLLFSVSAGGGKVENAEQITDAKGIARVGAWFMGPSPGPNELKGEVDGLAPVFFKAQALPDQRGSFTKAAGDKQIQRAGDPLPIAPTVLIADQNGRPMVGRTVTFTLRNGGRLERSSAQTDAEGKASAGIWTLGSIAGNQALQASTDGNLPSVEFIAQATTADAPNFAVETVLEGLANPWELIFLPDGDILYTLRSRGIYRLPRGQRSPVELARPGDLNPRTQSGMLGIALDPNFATNRFVYSFQSSNRSGATDNRIRKWRLAEDKSRLTEIGDILTGISWGSDGGHSGGRLLFGPDGFLYISTGDTRSATAPQNLNLLGGGKILRITTEGAPAPGNVMANNRRSEIYAHGFRNVQGITFRSEDRGGGLFSCEHGPNQDDEVTRVTLGGNAGWDPNDGNNNYNGYTGAQMTDLRKFPQAMRPTFKLADSVGMSGCTFFKGSKWKAWEGNLAVGVLEGNRIHIFEPNRTGDGIVRPATATLQNNGRVRSLIMGPDDDLYVVIDADNSGRILRLRPTN